MGCLQRVSEMRASPHFDVQSVQVDIPGRDTGTCIDPGTIDGPGCHRGDAPDSRHHAEYRRNRPASSLPDSSPSKPTPKSVAARLDVDERLLLFCIASGTDSGVLSLADGGCGVAAGGDSGESRNRASELLAAMSRSLA